jgi:uncharacterized membrane protein YcaP (DUF421 family)
MDLVLRAAFAFLLIFLVTRIIGRRELGTLEPFDVILLVVVGDLVQQGVTQSDQSVTGLTIVLGTLSFMIVLLSYVSFRFPRLRPLLEGEPVVLVEDGRVIERNLRRERLSRNDLVEALRMQQVATLDEVRWAVLETSGTISVIPKQGS